MLIEIEHGCTRVLTRSDVWAYSVVQTVDGSIQESVEEVHTFYAPDRKPPRIGDFIDTEAHELVRRTKPKVNNDWSKWKDKDL